MLHKNRWITIGEIVPLTFCWNTEAHHVDGAPQRSNIHRFICFVCVRRAAVAIADAAAAAIAPIIKWKCQTWWWQRAERERSIERTNNNIYFRFCNSNKYPSQFHWISFSCSISACAAVASCVCLALVMLRRCSTTRLRPNRIGVRAVCVPWGGRLATLCWFFLYVYWLRNVCLLARYSLCCRVYLGFEIFQLPDETVLQFIWCHSQKVSLL